METAVRACKSKAEAQALANFLWNEAVRHLDDIAVILQDLDDIKSKWKVEPTCKKEFVKP